MNELLYLGNRDVADETDVAQAFQLNENAQAEAAIRALMKPEYLITEDGWYCPLQCVDCGENIPVPRLQMERKRCISCQALIERY